MDPSNSDPKNTSGQQDLSSLLSNPPPASPDPTTPPLTPPPSDPIASPTFSPPPDAPPTTPTPDPNSSIPSSIPTVPEPAAPASTFNMSTNPTASPYETIQTDQPITSGAGAMDPGPIDSNPTTQGSTDLGGNLDQSANPSSPSWPSSPSSSQGTDLNTPQPETESSPLDNPLGAPTQPPVIDGNLPNSFPTPPAPTDWTVANQPSNEPTQMTPTEPVSNESVPTDLSHLINNSTPPTFAPPPIQPETLVVPPDGNTSVPNIPTEGDHKSFPKWILGVGIGLLLLVVGASAYFILGIGQPTEDSVSTPATTGPITTPAPTLTPTPTPPSDATGSGTFGGLNGATPTPQATSAADLIKRRQQGL